MDSPATGGRPAREDDGGAGGGDAIDQSAARVGGGACADGDIVVRDTRDCAPRRVRTRPVGLAEARAWIAARRRLALGRARRRADARPRARLRHALVVLRAAPLRDARLL